MIYKSRITVLLPCLHKLAKRKFHFSPTLKTYEERDHLKRTENSPRESAMFSAKVEHMEMLSSNIKKIVFKLKDSTTSFKAGQWVDMFIPSLTTVGGFSVCSSPSELQRGHLELAIKFSDHPPAYWTHTTCKVGDKVDFRFGGTFYWDPQPSECRHNLLLIAGGVGVNPLYSMLKHRRDLQEKFGDGYHSGIICSSASPRDCIYRKEIETICNEIPNSFCRFHATRTHDNDFINHRITKTDLEKYISTMKENLMKIYICGPPMFIDFIAGELCSLGVDKSVIYYEKWW